MLGTWLGSRLDSAICLTSYLPHGASVFAYHVHDLERYGVVLRCSPLYIAI
jgi:dTDP-glucose pyrophosphorylase